MEADGIEPNLIMLNLLMNAFAIAGRHMEATAIFEHIKESVSYFFTKLGQSYFMVNGLLVFSFS